jgi:hypothetical protein
MPEVTPAESAAFPKLEELIATLHSFAPPVVVSGIANKPTRVSYRI